jgi:hypothetical protein
VYFFITAASSVCLVALLGLAAFFPLRVSITAEEREEKQERGTRSRRRPRPAKYYDDDELFFDDDEL